MGLTIDWYKKIPYTDSTMKRVQRCRNCRILSLWPNACCTCTALYSSL